MLTKRKKWKILKELNIGKWVKTIHRQKKVPNNEIPQFYLNNTKSNFIHRFKFTNLSERTISDIILKISTTATGLGNLKIN